MILAPLAELLDRAVEAGDFPAAQAAVDRRGALVHASAHGRTPAAPATDDTIFDVASLTKVLSTTAIAASLLDRGAIRLDDPARRFLPSFAGGEKARVTIRHLLAHTSGLPAWRPLFLAAPEVFPAGGDFAGARRKVVERALFAPLERTPGERCVYSDLGFIALGELLSRAAGAPLDRLFAELVAAPLGLAARFHPDNRPPPAAYAPTGRTRPRPPARGQEGLYDLPPQPEADRAGEVDDDNAWAMGGVAGHAGLFSTARDVARFGARILDERAGAGRIARPQVWAELLAPDPHEGPPRALGFDLPSGPASSAGTRMPRAFGHLAFTGCSLWIDPERDLAAALLTNRVYPIRSNEAGIRRVRPAFHDLLVATLEP